MQLTPEIKAQLEEQKKQCVFCKLISGEMQAKKVFEDDRTAAMLDIYPARKGHVLFMPKEHYPILPYLPKEEFHHFFGLVPQLSKALKKAVVATAMNVFIASGGAAGQQSSHFLLHLLPRDEKDGFFNFYFSLNKKTSDEQSMILASNVQRMMHSTLKSDPAVGHIVGGSQPVFLKNIYRDSKIIYEDEKVLCIISNKCAVPGHIEIYSKEEESLIENLTEESSSHLFLLASSSATAVFEGMKAHGTNIILKSGKTDDNPSGILSIHVIPRFVDDSLKDILWKPQQPSYNLDDVTQKIKDKIFEIVNIPRKIKNASISLNRSTLPDSSKEEIRKAIEKLNY